MPRFYFFFFFVFCVLKPVSYRPLRSTKSAVQPNHPINKISETFSLLVWSWKSSYVTWKSWLCSPTISWYTCKIGAISWIARGNVTLHTCTLIKNHSECDMWFLPIFINLIRNLSDTDVWDYSISIGSTTNPKHQYSIFCYFTNWTFNSVRKWSLLTF